MDRVRVAALADGLLAAFDERRTIEPITASEPSFDVAAGYAVLREIQTRRTAAGWRPVGRKIGFTNRTIWARYGVDRAIWAPVYAETVRRAPDGVAALAVSDFVQPRIEPEVVFGVRRAVPSTGDARAVLDAVDWVAAGFEVVQSVFSNWKFRPPDCIAAFGLHAALIVGPTISLDDRGRDRIAGALADCEVTLYRDAEVVDRGRGSHALGSPALALQHLADVLASHPDAPSLGAGEKVTTGTLTDAWPLASGTRWHADYGLLGLPGIDLTVV